MESRAPHHVGNVHGAAVLEFGQAVLGAGDARNPLFTGWGPNGITQRIGLTTLDVWMMGTGVALIRDRTQFHFDPDTYLQLMAAEMPAYERLQDEEAAATQDIEVARILELGTGTGETARRVLALHPGAAYVGIDYGEAMLARAKKALPDADLRLGRLEEELPAGPFDLVISALVVWSERDLTVLLAEPASDQHGGPPHEPE